MWRWLLTWLLLSQASLVYAADSWQLLQVAADSARQLSYRGIFVYQTGSNTRSVQITHMNYGQGEYARSIVLDGSPREVLSQGSELVIYSPKNEKVVITKRRAQNLFPALLPPETDELKTSYEVRMGGQERVGGRIGQVVFLDSRDQYRYGYKFWTDQQYGLILKSVTFNENNDPVEQITFTQLTLLDTKEMDWFQPNVDPTKSYVMEEEPVALTSADLDLIEITQLPPGYRKIDQVKRMVPGKRDPVTHFIFSDGLATVSLFIEPLNKRHPKIGPYAMGATNFYTQINDDYQIVAVGEVPAATVAQLANAVKFKK